MIDIENIIIEQFVTELKASYHQMYNLMEPHYGNMLEWIGRLALANIANSDALYHNVAHTIMVTSVGQAILKGKHLIEGGVTPHDWSHYIMALLCHDIGYVRGVCRLDTDSEFATGIGDEVITLPHGSTDASLTPYHVDRSKQFVRDRFSQMLVSDIDADRVADYIEMTRFPIPESHQVADTGSYACLARAADFIGQLGDPNYLRKIPALFYEFEEVGANKQAGYTSPGEMRQNFTSFYWGVVRPHIQDALYYLKITHEGKQWIANLHSHVFHVEHEAS